MTAIVAGGTAPPCDLAARIACVRALGVARYPSEESKDAAIKITIAWAETSLTVDLLDSRAARQLAERLPLTIELSDFHGVEKVAHLTDRLEIYGEPEGFEPRAGDVGYFTPWGNIGFFYGDSEYAIGLIKLGTIEGDVSALEGIADDSVATLSLAE